jgi:hypothetical protein
MSFIISMRDNEGNVCLSFNIKVEVFTLNS